MEPQWLLWVRKLQSIAQNGMAFTPNIFDRERFMQIRELAAEIAATYTDAPPARVLGLYDAERGYATPKVDVRGVVFRGDDLLLVREKADHGYWTLPGGWADVNNPPSEAAVREIHEETGYRTRALKVMAVFDRTKQGHPPYIFHAYKLFFMCELIADQPDAAETDYETDEPTFFSAANIPTDLSLGRITPQQIALCFTHHHHMDRPTDFD